MKYRHLFSSHNQDQLALVQSLLDAEGIDYQIQNEMFSSIRPLAEPAELVVADQDYEKAKGLIENLSISLSPSWRKERKKEDPAGDNVLNCMSCGTEIPEGLSACPSCGWTYDTNDS